MGLPVHYRYNCASEATWLTGSQHTEGEERHAQGPGTGRGTHADMADGFTCWSVFKRNLAVGVRRDNGSSGGTSVLHSKIRRTVCSGLLGPLPFLRAAEVELMGPAYTEAHTALRTEAHSFQEPQSTSWTGL